MTSRRSILLGSSLLLTLVATWYASEIDADSDELLATPQRNLPVTRAELRAELSLSGVQPATHGPPGYPHEQRMTREGGDLFAPQSWRPPPPPPIAAPPAPAPRAPELPFRYLGRLEEDGKVIAFLAEGGQQLPRVVRQGDLLLSYRVDEITSQGMRLTYLPLNETQRLLFGNTP